MAFHNGNIDNGFSPSLYIGTSRIIICSGVIRVHIHFCAGGQSLFGIVIAHVVTLAV
jgi:hypothetical protein